MDLKLYPLDRQACELRIASCKYTSTSAPAPTPPASLSTGSPPTLTILSPDGWTTDDLIYHWKADDPVQITDDLNLPRYQDHLVTICKLWPDRFKLELFETSYCNTVTNTGEYSCLKVTQHYLLFWPTSPNLCQVLMVFKREFSYYLLTIYVPSCMLVIVSWVGSTLDHEETPLVGFFLAGQ